MTVKTPLKWVGSKARLMPQLLPHLPEGKRLIEPFAGSCAVMMNTDYDEYLIGDINPDLVNLYKAMAYHTDAFLVELETLFSAGSLGEEESRAVFYYAVRDLFNQSEKGGANCVESAARFMYLNRHGFNGLCRYNRRGQFNVPFGKYKKPYFPLDEIHAFKEVAIKWSAAPDMTPQTVLYRRPVAQFSNFQPKIVSSWLILALFQANFLISGRSRLCPYQLVNSNQVRQGE